MPSIRHRVVTAFIAATMRTPAAPDDQTAATRVRDGRPSSDATPPRGVRRSVAITTDKSRGWPVHTLTPRVRTASAPPILYLHGGAYVSDIAPAHWTIAARLAVALGCVVHLPRYPLAPEHGWQESRAGLLDLLRPDAHGLAPVVMGDSAGGGLALSLVQELAGPAASAPPAISPAVSSAVPPAVVLIAPWVDLLLDQPTAELASCRDPWLDADSLRQLGRLWAAGDDPARPELSPAQGDLGSLPPTLVVTGTRDVLHPQALALVDAVRRAGGEIDLLVGPGLIHVYPLLPIPEAGPALDRIVGFITAHTQEQVG